MRISPLLLITILTLAAAPPAVATWYGPGTYEPDTAQDHGGGMMFLEPDASADQARHQVYFNVFPAHSFATPLNPNSGTLGSRALPQGMLQFWAQLGVWKDCNADGYIGMAETLVLEYRSELLFEPDICPAGTLHNSGAWVREFIAIMPDGSDAEDGVFAIPSTYIWGDFGLPGATPAAVCLNVPIPHGTTSGTGALIRYADCMLGGAITGAANTVDPDGSQGIGFADPNNPQQSDSILNQHFPVNFFGNPTTGQHGILEKETHEESFGVWDCQAERTTVNDLDGAEVLSLPAVAPRVGDLTSGSAFNATGQAYDGALGDCSSNSPNDVESTHGVFIFADADFEGTAQVPAKRQSDFNFLSFPRASQFFDLTSLMDGVTGKDTPLSGGVYALDTLLLAPVWTSAETFTTADAEAIGLLEGTAASYFSFYASIDRTAMNDRGFSTPSPADFVYGAEACPAIGTGVPATEWECDPANWWRDPAGNDISTPSSQRAGSLYQLRDIDCYDNSPARTVSLGACVDAPLS